MGWTRYFRRRRWDEERALELQAYLDQETDDNVARGMPPDEARRAAHRRLGNPTLIREEIYQMNTLSLVENLWRDLGFGLRLLRKNPTFAVVAVLTLALGTGANTAIFQLVEAVQLRRLPVANPHELVEIRIDTHGQGRTGSFMSRRPLMTNVLWERIQARQEAFASMLAWSPTRFDLAGGGEERPAEGLWVSGSFFQMLGVQASLGRVLLPSDDVRGCLAPGAVLSDAFWRREYGGDPRVLERTILLDGHRFDIVGVTPPGFFGVEVGRRFDVAIPLCSEQILRGSETLLDRPDAWFLAVMGRLAPGWDVERAGERLRAISPPIFRDTLPPDYVPQDAKSYLAFNLLAIPAGTGVSGLRAAYSTPLSVLLGLTGLVLLITCANLANLMLARATAREREISVRLAIGASRGRLVRQMLAESLLLAVAGAVGGVALAAWLSGFLVTLLSSDSAPLFLDLSFNWRVFAFAAGLAAAACLLFGLAPALRATRVGASLMLITRGATDGVERFTFRRALVVVQVALSMVLVVGALLFGRSLQKLAAIDPGFRENGLLVVSLDFRRAQVPPENRRALYSDMIERLRSVPGVATAAEARIAPMSGAGWNNRVLMDGKLLPGNINFNAVGPDFFRAMGTRMVTGRDFTAADGPSAPPVALVNELYARRFLPGQDPIGRTLQAEERASSRQNPRYQIIGVVADTKYSELREELTPIVYLSALQQPELDPYLQVVLHSATDFAGVTPGISRVIQEVNPNVSVQFQTMRRLVQESLISERLMATLSGFFGVLAILIATIGLYGVMSYMVTRRRMEIGIRMALGADRANVIRMVLGDAARLLVVGLAVGVGLAVAGARSAEALLYGLRPWDPVTILMAVVLLGGIALLASWLPAQRAAGGTATIALREQ